MKISPSENAGPARTADGAGGEGVGELHPGLGYHFPGPDQGSSAAHSGVLSPVCSTLIGQIKRDTVLSLVGIFYGIKTQLKAPKSSY